MPDTRMIGSHIRLHMAMLAFHMVVGARKSFLHSVSDVPHGVSEGILIDLQKCFSLAVVVQRVDVLGG